MADKNDKNNDDRMDASWPVENDALSRELDAALAKYSAVGPRDGLEDRVLTNLRAERAQVTPHAWSGWRLFAALATVVIVALALAWRYGKTQPPTATHNPPPSPSMLNPEKQLASNRGGELVLPQNRRQVQKAFAHPSPPSPIPSQVPKLDQFPSPAPLSEQEKILANYVAKYPEQAVLIARARSEALRRDQLEEMNLSSSDNGATDSQEQSYDTTDR